MVYLSVRIRDVFPQIPDPGIFHPHLWQKQKPLPPPPHVLLCFTKLYGFSQRGFSETLCIQRGKNCPELNSTSVFFTLMVIKKSGYGSGLEKVWILIYVPTVRYRQCGGSRMFIPDPGSWFLPIPDPGSRIQKQQQKREVKKLVLIPFYVASNFTKL